ncbi:MAG TPA: hypothetical protein VGF17_27155 [Phytomonospora sp.]
MSDLFRITVDGKSGATVTGRVHVVHPDAGDVPPGHDFALKMIIEVWHRMREGFIFDDPRFPDSVHIPPTRAREYAGSLDVADELQRLRDLDRGAHVVLTEAQAAEIRAAGKSRDKSAVHRLMALHGVDRLNIGLLDGAEYLRAERDPEAFQAEARAIVTDYRVGAMKSLPAFWEYDDEEIDAFAEAGFGEFDEPFDIDDYRRRQDRARLDDYPHAAFTLTVRDPRYLAHLDRGVHLATAIYGEFGWDD